MILDTSAHEKVAARAQIKFGYAELDAASEAAEMVCGSHHLGAIRGQRATPLIWGEVTGQRHEGPRIG